MRSGRARRRSVWVFRPRDLWKGQLRMRAANTSLQNLLQPVPMLRKAIEIGVFGRTTPPDAGVVGDHPVAAMVGASLSPVRGVSRLAPGGCAAQSRQSPPASCPLRSGFRRQMTAPCAKRRTARHTDSASGFGQRAFKRSDPFGVAVVTRLQSTGSNVLPPRVQHHAEPPRVAVAG